MANNITIDEEIEGLELALRGRKDTHPDYMPDRLEQLQALVLASHARLENGLETRIYLQIKRGLRSISDAAWNNTILALQPLLETITYRNKLEIAQGYGDETAGLIEALRKVNSYRIEFAHPEGLKLRNKYNYNNPQGKQQIKDLLRSLDKAEREMDNYFIKVYGVPKMREKVA